MEEINLLPEENKPWVLEYPGQVSQRVVFDKGTDSFGNVNEVKILHLSLPKIEQFIPIVVNVEIATLEKKDDRFSFLGRRLHCFVLVLSYRQIFFVEELLKPFDPDRIPYEAGFPVEGQFHVLML